MASPLLQLPLHIIAIVLGRLGTIQELYPVILSHRIFRDAFHDNLHSVARNIVTRQIPANTLPFTVALLESTWISGGRPDAVRDILTRLETTCSSETIDFVFPPASRLSISDYAYLSKIYTAAESLSKSFTDEVIPIADAKIRLPRLSREVTQQENFRLNRAFLRYQLMVNLFCAEENPFENGNQTRQNLAQFFSTFSPWVNEQLTCVYHFLLRKVTDALNEVVLHDVDWAIYPVLLPSTLLNTDSRGDIHWFLAQGLQLLSSVVSAKTFNKRAGILRPDVYLGGRPRYPPRFRLKSMKLWGPRDDRNINLKKAGERNRLARPSDGPTDSTFSNPCIIWLRAHGNRSVVDDTMWNDRDAMLWETGYVLWDYANVFAHHFKTTRRALRFEPPNPLGSRAELRRYKLSRSQGQRIDIRFDGGSGYWPLDGEDFSRIQGLSKKKIEGLLRKWEDTTPLAD